MKTKYYKVQEFAKRTGVTVRALHHYDRLGLLKPTGYTEGGYRLYSEADFLRLQQIVTLKFIGLSLNQIKSLFNRKEFDLLKMLQLQRKAIEYKRNQLSFTIAAIESAEELVRLDKVPSEETFTKIIEVINMYNNREWLKNYYSDEQLDKLAARYSPELQKEAENQWAALIKDVEQALGEDPTSQKAQLLAKRWTALIESFTMGDAGVTESLKKLYEEKQNWPANFKKPYSDEVEAFISKAIAAQKQ